MPRNVATVIVGMLKPYHKRWQSRLLCGVLCAAFSACSIPLLARAKKGHGHQVIVANPPPTAPSLASNPNPADGATGVSTTAILSWTAATGATSYTVKFGSSNPPTTVSVGQVGTTYNPGTTLSGTVYYWQVIATNSSGSNTGPVWSYTSGFATPPGVLGANNVQWLGMILIPCNGTDTCDNTEDGKMAMYYDSSNVRHLLVSNSSVPNRGGRYAPADMIDPAVYATDGTCTANCPSTVVTSAPTLTAVGDWGTNANGSAYDWRHGTMQVTFNGGSLFEICPETQLGPCQSLMHYYMVPNSNPPRLFLTYGGPYSGFFQYNMIFCDLITPPVANTTSPVTQCYGPFNSEAPVPMHPGDTNTNQGQPDSNRLYGSQAGQMFFNFPDGSVGVSMIGGGAGSGASKGLNGPSIFKLASGLPTPTSVAGISGPNILASTKYLAYYNMVAHGNADGSVPAGQPIWSFRTPGYPYLYEETPCALNLDNPIGPPSGCLAPFNYPYVGSGGASLAIDPIKNAGVGTMGENDGTTGVVWYQGATKAGVLFFLTQATNHLLGDVRDCTHVVQGYCNGAYKGNSGHTCSGANDGGFGHPGDSLSPRYECLYTNVSTGPSDTGREPQIVIYNPADLQAVAAGTTTDYTVDPVARVYLQSTFGSNFRVMPNGMQGPVGYLIDVARDPRNPHIIYASAPMANWPNTSTCPGACFNAQVVIHVFRITES